LKIAPIEAHTVAATAN